MEESRVWIHAAAAQDMAGIMAVGGVPSQSPSPEPEPSEAPSEGKLRPLSRIEVACLDVCIELLNQSVRVHDYECALVCALSVLGVRGPGWKDEDDYPGFCPG